MPWSIVDDHDECEGFAVVDDETGDMDSCHQSRDDAEARMSELMAEADMPMDHMPPEDGRHVVVVGENGPEVFVPKSVQTLTAEIKTAKAADGSYDFVLSMPELDRDGEIIDAKALEWRTPGRMPIDVDHGMTVLTTVGSGIPVYDGSVLKLNDFRFASTALAQDVKSLVDEGHISKASVAFMDAQREKDEKDGKIHVRKAELLNAAIVAIPSLRQAEIAAAKAALAKVGARNSAADQAHIQAMHDSAVALGAACEKKSAACGCGKSTGTDPEEKAAAPAAANPPADVNVGQLRAELLRSTAALARM